MMALPTEVLMMIIEQLNFEDVKNCRLVCSKWKDVADQILLDSPRPSFAIPSYLTYSDQMELRKAIALRILSWYEPAGKTLWSKRIMKNVRATRVYNAKDVIKFMEVMGGTSGLTPFATGNLIINTVDLKSEAISDKTFYPRFLIQLGYLFLSWGHHIKRLVLILEEKFTGEMFTALMNLVRCLPRVEDLRIYGMNFDSLRPAKKLELPPSVKILQLHGTGWEDILSDLLGKDNRNEHLEELWVGPDKPCRTTAEADKIKFLVPFQSLKALTLYCPTLYSDVIKLEKTANVLTKLEEIRIIFDKMESRAQVNTLVYIFNELDKGDSSSSLTTIAIEVATIASPLCTFERLLENPGGGKFLMEEFRTDVKYLEVKKIFISYYLICRFRYLFTCLTNKCPNVETVLLAGKRGTFHKDKIECTTFSKGFIRFRKKLQKEYPAIKFFPIYRDYYYD